MTTTGPTARHVKGTAFLLAVIAVGHLCLRTRDLDGPDLSPILAATSILLVVVVLITALLAFGIRTRRGSRSITLPWCLLRRAIDVAIIATVAVGFAVTTHAADQNSDSIGTLNFDGNQPSLTGTVHLSAGDVAVWYAVHCDDCGEINNDRTLFVHFPKQTLVAVSGPAAVSVHQGKHPTITTHDRLGIRQQRKIGQAHISTPGAYTLRVHITPYALPHGRDPYLGRQVLVGVAQPALIDQTRLLVIAALLALSVLIMLRPRRVPASEPVPSTQPV